MSDQPVQHLYPDLSGKTILIAEDLDVNYRLIEAILKKTKAKLIWAKDGKEAVDFCTNDCSQIHLILMDLKMPVMSGIEAASVISRICPGLPIIAQTAFGIEYSRGATLSAGCVDYIEKPLTLRKVLDVVTKYIN
ncbi:MAG: response regulator [Bacteroidales bacterium]